MLFIVLLVSTIFVIVAGIKFSIWCTDKLTNIIVTQRFQDAEFIVHNNNYRIDIKRFKMYKIKATNNKSLH